MSISGVHLITGLIGSGKTLRAVSLIEKEIEAGRPVYVCNVNGLNIPGVIPFDNPRDWQDLPPGALLVVDEVQKFWRARRSGDVPAELQAMETSRHDAVSFLLMTQQPTYLDKHLRGLIGKHEHLFRRAGAQASSLYSWDRCHDDPMSATSKEGADESLFVFPKRLFGSYKSSEQHTVKYKMGLRMKMVLVSFVAVACIGFWIYTQFSSAKEVNVAAIEGRAAATPEASRQAASVNADTTPEAYLARQVPRLASQPWSAPQFDASHKVRSEPAAYCMASSRSCTCLTEQGTRYRLAPDDAGHDARCRDMARNGPVYNPFKAVKREAQQRVATGTKEKAQVNPQAAVLSGPQAIGYGDIAVPGQQPVVGDMAGVSAN